MPTIYALALVRNTPITWPNQCAAFLIDRRIGNQKDVRAAE
jgi:hypothetical protein